MVVGAILAMTTTGVIGLNGTIPWRYPLDFRRFADVTANSTVVMGRLTWESLPKRPGHDVPVLPGRKIVVVSSNEGWNYPMVNRFRCLSDALGCLEGDIWLIGGKRIYEEAIEKGLADVIDVTVVPDMINDPAAVKLDVTMLENYDDVRYVSHPDPRLVTFNFKRTESKDANG